MDSLVKNEYNDAIKNYNDLNFKQAFDSFLNLANQDISEAQMEVAYMLYEGKGIEQDIEQSLYWFQKNVDKNNIEAIRMLGWCYLQLNKIEEGITYLNKALEQGSIEAIVDIGSFHDFGDYTFKIDKEKALEYYRKGCNSEVRDGCRYMVLLLKEMNINSTEYIQKHIGYFKFLKIMLYGRIGSFINFLFQNKCKRT